MSDYNAKYEVDCRYGLEDEDIQDLLDVMDKYGPYIMID